MNTEAELKRLLQERILLLDGAMGTQIQSRSLTPEDFGGKDGCNDFLSVTRPDVVEAPNAATDRQGNVDALGGSAHDVEHDVPILVRCGDVEEDQLIRALRVLGECGRDGIAGVAQIDEPDALDDPTVLDVETWDDPLGQHQPRISRSATSRSMAPV